jgi:hypothetical protein
MFTSHIIMANAFFIDFEAFQHGEEDFHVKELCIIDANRPMEPLYYVFQPDVEWEALSSDAQKTYNYETRRHHHLHWLDGITRYCKECIMHHVKSKFPNFKDGIFYVLDKPQGAKVKFLSQEFPLLRMVNYTGVTFKTLPEPCYTLECPYRQHGKHCAYRKCLQLYTHFNSLDTVS